MTNHHLLWPARERGRLEAREVMEARKAREVSETR